MKRSLILLVSLLCSCVSKAPEILPQKAGEWTRSGEVRTFRADELWRYIDGDAEHYLHAGVRRTVTTRYRRPDGIEAVADAHEMADAAAARRIFESDEASGSRPCNVGEQCRLYGQMLTYHRGRNFVRLTAYEDSPNIADALTGLAKSVDAGMSGRRSE